ncbi:MAG: hypothetical protein ACKPAD_05015, partial [Bacteroidota bacterium]
MGSIRGILNQRIRWASKMSGYGKPDITLMGAFISLVNLVPLLLLVLCMIDFLPFWFFLVWLLLKFALDMILLKPIASFYKQSNALAISPLYALV